MHTLARQAIVILEGFVVPGDQGRVHTVRHRTDLHGEAAQA